MNLYPIYGERALFIEKGKTIVIADLHIGIEYEYSLQGVNIGSQTEKMLERCISIIKKKKAKRVIILGDLKHTIVQSGEEYEEAVEKEKKDVRYFIKKLAEIVELWIIKGNHDGQLKSKRAKIFGIRGISIGRVSLIHGHAWPSPAIMKNDLLIMGHIHPHVRIRTKIGYSYTQPCWVRGHFKKELLKKYKDANKNMEFIIMPAFNPLAGGVAVNREKIGGAIISMIDADNSFIYLLDGTNLGRIRNLR